MNFYSATMPIKFLSNHNIISNIIFILEAEEVILLL